MLLPLQSIPQVALAFGQMFRWVPIHKWLVSVCFGSPDIDQTPEIDIQGPLEHSISSVPSSSCLSLGAVCTSSIKHLLSQTPPLPKQPCVIPCAAGSHKVPAVMGWHSL